jgi:hypothetical protein
MFQKSALVAAIAVPLGLSLLFAPLAHAEGTAVATMVVAPATATNVAASGFDVTLGITGDPVAVTPDGTTRSLHVALGAVTCVSSDIWSSPTANYTQPVPVSCDGIPAPGVYTAEVYFGLWPSGGVGATFALTIPARYTVSPPVVVCGNPIAIKWTVDATADVAIDFSVTGVGHNLGFFSELGQWITINVPGDGDYGYLVVDWDTGQTQQYGEIVVNCSGYDQFVKAAYQDFLGRAPSASELAAKTGPLAAGTLSKQAFLSTMANSDEWLNAIVTKMYADTLGRAPDAAGLAGWTTFLRNKTLTVADVASRFYASDEYYLYHAGGTPTSWVTALYQKLLNRTPDAAGLAAWVANTSSPAWGRARVAFEFYQSLESRLKRVDALYQVLLGRAPDPVGWPFWANTVLSTGDITLAVSLADSEEYWLRAKARF